VTSEGGRRPAVLAPLRHRNLRLFFAGQGVSLVGSWMQAVGQAWLVLTLTRSPFLRAGLAGTLAVRAVLRARAAPAARTI
jgi:Transmembrane secretion effector